MAIRRQPTPPYTSEEILWLIDEGEWTPQVAQAHAAAGGISGGTPQQGPQQPGEQQSLVDKLTGTAAKAGGKRLGENIGAWLTADAPTYSGLSPVGISEIFGPGWGMASPVGTGTVLAPLPVGTGTVLAPTASGVGSAATGLAPTTAGATTGTGTTTGLGSAASTFGQYVAGPAATAYGAYNLVDNFGDMENSEGAMSGAGMGAGIAAMMGLGPVGWAAAIALGLLGGTGLAQFSSGKHPEQKDRDMLRDRLEEYGLAAKDPDTGSHLATLASGETFDIGRDDREPYYNVGYGTPDYIGWSDLEEGTATPGQVTQFIDENYGETVGALNPLMSYFSGYQPKWGSDLTGYFTNAAHSSGDPSANIQSFYEQSGLDRNTLYGATVNAYEEGKLDAATADAYRAAIDKVFGVVNPNQGLGGAAEGKFVDLEAAQTPDIGFDPSEINVDEIFMGPQPQAPISSVGGYSPENIEEILRLQGYRGGYF